MQRKTKANWDIISRRIQQELGGAGDVLGASLQVLPGRDVWLSPEVDGYPQAPLDSHRSGNYFKLKVILI
jgi:hypothetical protein